MQMGTDKLTSPLGVSTESYLDIALDTISECTDQFCIGSGQLSGSIVLGADNFLAV